MPADLLDTALSLVLPFSLFVASLSRVHDKARRASTRNLGDLVWVGVFVMVNVIACFWSAAMLDSVRIDGRVSAEQAATTYSSGLYLFATLALVLFFGPAIAYARRLVTRLCARRRAT